MVAAAAAEERTTVGEGEGEGEDSGDGTSDNVVEGLGNGAEASGTSVIGFREPTPKESCTRHVHHPSSSCSAFPDSFDDDDDDEKKSHVQCRRQHGYTVRRNVLTPKECLEAIDEMTLFVNDVGRVPNDRRDTSPRPSFPLSIVFRTHGAGWILLSTKEALAERTYRPIFGTDELRCSSEGFVFWRKISNVGWECEKNVVPEGVRDDKGRGGVDDTMRDASAANDLFFGDGGAAGDGRKHGKVKDQDDDGDHDDDHNDHNDNDNDDDGDHNDNDNDNDNGDGDDVGEDDTKKNGNNVVDDNGREEFENQDNGGVESTTTTTTTTTTNKEIISKKKAKKARRKQHWTRQRRRQQQHKQQSRQSPQRWVRCFAALSPCEIVLASIETITKVTKAEKETIVDINNDEFDNQKKEGGKDHDVRVGPATDALTLSLGAGDVALWDSGSFAVRSVGKSTTTATTMTTTIAAGMFVTMIPAVNLLPRNSCRLPPPSSSPSARIQTNEEDGRKNDAECNDDTDIGAKDDADEERRWTSRIAFYRRTLTGDFRIDASDDCLADGTMPDGDGDGESGASLKQDEHGEEGEGGGDRPNNSPSNSSFFRRPYFRYGPPALSLKQAQLFGLVPYRQRIRSERTRDEKEEEKKTSTTTSSPPPAMWSDNAIVKSITAHPDREVVRAIFRGVVFQDESYYRLIPEDGEAFDDIVCHPNPPPPDPLRIHRVRSCNPDVAPQVKTQVLRLADDAPMMGQDKYLGGVASPCGEYVYGMPGFARRVLSVHVPTGAVELIGDTDHHGPFKWLRGVELPPTPQYPRGLCIGLPSNANSVLKIDPQTQAVSTFGTDSGLLDGVWQYHGGQMYPPTRMTYAVPANARRVLKIDAYNETLVEIGPDFGDGKQKWYGGIYSKYDDCIYCIPHNETGVLKIDPSKDEARVIGNHLPKGLWKWHGGLSTRDGRKIIGFPNNADSILIVDVPTETVYTIDGMTTGAGGGSGSGSGVVVREGGGVEGEDGRAFGRGRVVASGRHRRPRNGKYKYLGGSLSLDGRYAYLFPSCAERVLRIDTVTDDVRCVGPLLLEGSCKYQNGFSSQADGAVYGIPQNARCAIRIIPPRSRPWSDDGKGRGEEEEEDDDDEGEEIVDMVYCGDSFLPYGDKFEGGVQGKDGSIYCMPLRAKAVLKIVPPVAPGRGKG